MYEDHYQVLDDPFRFTPDEHPAFQHHSYLSGVAFLQHVLDHSRKVLILIYGVSGVGKSTLVNDILRRQDASKVQAATIKASNISSHGILVSIARAFGLTIGKGEKELVQQLNDYLREKSSQNLYSLFVVEDAHELSPESLNHLGQLVRLIWDNRYKMKIFLIGSPVLDQLLYQSKIEQLQKKIVIGWNQHGMGENEIGDYVAHRIRNVGGVKLDFENLVWRTLYDFSDGNPRRINRICNKLLLNGFIDKKLSFVNADIMDAVRQLDNEGLLEVKKSFATLHGLKGTSNEFKEDAKEIEAKKFAEGFSNPLLVKDLLFVEEGSTSSSDNSTSNTEPVTLTTRVEPKKPVAPKRPAVAKKPAVPKKEKSITEQAIKIPVDLRTHPALARFEENPFKSLLIEWRFPIIVVILGLVGTLVFLNNPFMGTDSTKSMDHTDPQATNIDTVIAKSKQTKPPVNDSAKTDNSLVTTKAPVAPKPKAVSDADAEQEKPGQKTKADASDATGVISQDTPVDDDIDVDESGDVEERARIAEEQAIAAAKAAKEKQTARIQEIEKEDNQAQTIPTFTTRQLKQMLLAGHWTRLGKPAVLLPSELNTCSESRKDIFCRSTEVISQSNAKKITSRTGAMFHQFSGDGTFNVAYRRSAQIESGNVSSDHGLKEYSMSCHFVSKSQIDCVKNGVLVKYVRRFKLSR